SLRRSQVWAVGRKGQKKSEPDKASSPLFLFLFSQQGDYHMSNPLFSANHHSNHNIFQVEHTGSVVDDVMNHISGLPDLHRLDYEHYTITGDVISTVEGDASPISQQDEEARIGSLAYTLDKLGDAVDAAEFNRCLNAICAEGDALYRQA